MEIPLNLPVICPIIIGRTSELTTLRLLIEQAKSGKGHVALISGEAGVGKSRLAGEAKAYATAHHFLLWQGNCFPTDVSCPYAPLLDLLRSSSTSTSPANTAASVDSIPPDVFLVVPDLVSPLSDRSAHSSLDPEQEKRRLFATVAHFFLSQLAKQPGLLVVEDVHWSDDTSLEFFQHLARYCAALPLLLLFTFRSDEVRPSLEHFLVQLDRERLARELTLAPLVRSDVDAMLRAIFSLPPSAPLELPDPIYALTEGNPFFVEEILTSLVATGEILYANGRWERKPLSELHIPRSVQQAVGQRTARLSDHARRVLVLAAVAGRRFDFTLLQQVTHYTEDELLSLFKELIAAQLVVEESSEQFAFRHALTRQAVYAELLVRERKALHRTIAETIEQLYAPALEAHLADLAIHFSEAEVWEKALEYGRRAGEQAQALYAPQAAIEQFTRALQATRHGSLPPSARLYRARGLAYETLGAFEQARADYDIALRMAHQTEDRHGEWQSLMDLGYLWAGRDYTQAGTYYERALALARTMNDPAALAHSLNRLGNWHLNVELPQEALGCHQEALATFEGLHDQHGIAETLDLLGMASYLSGDLRQSTAYYEQAITLLRALDERKRLPSSLATLVLSRGNYQTETLLPPAMGLTETLHHGELALKIAREIGQRSDEAYTLIHLSMCLGPQGEYARALEQAQRGLALAEDIEHRQWMSAGHWALGALYFDLLVLEAAQQHLEQALALAHEIGSQFLIRIVSGLLARVALAQHDVTRAETILGAALGPHDPPQTLGQRIIWDARAELAFARDDCYLALHIVDQLVTSAANLAQESTPRLLKLRGEIFTALKQGADAEMALHQARVTGLKYRLRPLLWRISLAQGKLAHSQRRYEEADRRFAEALEMLEDLASSLPDEPLQQHFLHHAHALFPHTRQPSPHRLAKKTFEGLTQRERAVAALIARGKSNREIADALSVTSGTIETHVSNILSKLNFSSRTQIAVWAMEKGLANQAL